MPAEVGRKCVSEMEEEGGRSVLDVTYNISTLIREEKGGKRTMEEPRSWIISYKPYSHSSHTRNLDCISPHRVRLIFVQGRVERRIVRCRIGYTVHKCEFVPVEMASDSSISRQK
jgi:hypothetical protein